jgi:hypothetical protein
VAWFEWQDNREFVAHLLDVQASRLFKRPIPVVGQDERLARSAAFETAALIVGATLEQIALGTVVGEPVDLEAEPQAPNPAEAREPPAPASPPDDGGAAQARTEPALRGFGEGGYRASFDRARLRHGPRLAVGLSGAERWIALDAGFFLPTSVQSEIPGSATALELESSEIGLGVTGGFRFGLGADFGLSLTAGPGVLVVRRKTTLVPDGVSPGGSRSALLPETHAGVRLTSPELGSSGLRFGLDVIGQILWQRPEWVVRNQDGEEETPLREQWSAFQPAAGLWLGFQAP